jgi:pimeloyl-ACP methyl ester carboxylesterase
VKTVVEVIDPPASESPSPQIRTWAAPGPTRAVVLVLHGGREAGLGVLSWRNSPVARMRPFARTIHSHANAPTESHSSPHGVAVWQLRFAVRGWNGSATSPVHDARWALQEVRQRHGDVPVVLLGHSMGGRTAMRVADDPHVVGAIGLAPWFPEGETVEPVRGQRISIAHGRRDKWVPASTSLRWAVRARAVTAELRRVELRGTGHAMLRRARTWHRLAATEAVRLLTSSVQPAGTNDGANLRQLV